MARLTVEIIPDVEEGGFTARVPDIPAYGERLTGAEAIADLKEAFMLITMRLESRPQSRVLTSPALCGIRTRT